jgi:hypothetical protein
MEWPKNGWEGDNKHPQGKRGINGGKRDLKKMALGWRAHLLGAQHFLNEGHTKYIILFCNICQFPFLIHGLPFPFCFLQFTAKYFHNKKAMNGFPYRQKRTER